MFGNCKVYLFGSRTDPTKKGGDIDLPVVLDKPLEGDEDLTFLARLRKRGILRKVDLLILDPTREAVGVYKTALEEGIRIL